MSNMNKRRLLKNLKAVQELLSDESRWTKGANARRAKKGAPVDPLDAKATCFCLGGAMHKVACDISVDGPLDELYSFMIKIVAINKPGFPTVPDFNDSEHTSHADVMAILEKAVDTVDTVEAAGAA
jgi:hypothetical protein